MFKDGIESETICQMYLFSTISVGSNLYQSIKQLKGTYLAIL
jgi:hypothetical protein